MNIKGHQLETAAIFLGPDSLFYNAHYYCLKEELGQTQQVNVSLEQVHSFWIFKFYFILLNYMVKLAKMY